MHPVRRKHPLRAVLSCARDFCLKTSMHGFTHIAAPGRSWLERVLWACACAAAILGAVAISLDQWQRYNDNPTVVALEKDFRTWKFSLPGLTICPESKVDATKLAQVIKQHWGVTPEDQKYGYYSRFVTAVASTDLFNVETLLEFEGEELEVDLYQLAVDVMPDLRGVKTTWSVASSVKWYPVMSEAGTCYATNSLAIADNAVETFNPNETAMFPLQCEYLSLTCYVTIEVQNPTKFYIHSPYDIMDVTSPPSLVGKGIDRNTELSVIETRCGRGVRALSPRRRRCLYHDEATDGRQVYTTNTCRRSCRNLKTLRQCGCKPFYNYHEEGPLCSLRGMRCMAAHAATLTTLDASCVCAPMCVDALFQQFSSETQIITQGLFKLQGVIRFKVQAPRTRYTREIVFHFQDLVVSFGGAAGLFIGSSFISFVEILYFILERILSMCLAPEQEDNQDKKIKQVKKTKIPYEQRRIMELTAILEQRSKLPSIGAGASHNIY